MSIPSNYVADLLNGLSQSRVENLVAQVDARRILQEVKEITENYPNFDPLLTEKATHIAYALLACGCSLIENQNSDSNEGLTVLEQAGKILSDTYKYNTVEIDGRNCNLLIAGMALYAAKQYSRAFIVLNDVDTDFLVGQMVAKYIKKDFHSLLQIASRTFFSTPPELLDVRELDGWVISHEISRCFLIITDFIHTGNQKNFTLTNDIFDKLCTLAAESNLTLYWLVVRLLKIIFSTFQETSLWSVLPPLLPAQYIAEKYIRLLSGFKTPVTEIWPSQTASLPLAVGENVGAVINLRTSGGKTRVAEVAILNTLSIHIMSKVLYLALFRSLAFEIEQTLSNTFAPLGIAVSQLYGGSTANVTDVELIKQSQVIIATPEKAKALIRCGSGLEEEIKLIVVDEGHLLGAQERHIKNELFFTHIKEFASRNQIRMLLLSAVLPNAHELAQWIANDATAVAKSNWKPALERLGLLLWDGNRVRLEWKSDGEPFNPNFIQKAPLGFGGGQKPFPNNKNEAVAATAVRLAESGTVMIYSARANSIEGLAKNVLLALGEHPQNFPWSNTLWKVFESTCHEELEKNDIVLEAARKGVICHNNRLPTLVRIAIERLMRSKPPRIIIASSTLAQGVNVGISAVIVSTPYYSDKAISNRDFWNKTFSAAVPVKERGLPVPIVLMEIQRVTQEANLHREAFLRRAMENHEAQLRKEMLSQEKELNKARKRLAELDTLFRTAFEQLALKHISDEQFQMLSGGYEQEKQELTNRIGLLEDAIAGDRDKMLNADRFLKIVDKYIAIQELTPEIVREFIDKVVVHDRSEPWKKKNYTQQVDVYFNFVGKV